MRKRIIFVIVFLILQAACSPGKLSTLTSSPTPAQPVNPTQPPTELEPIRVQAWVDNPTPALNSRIVVRGSLIKYKFNYVGGIMMTALWPDDQAERGVPNCFTQVTYGTGKCVIDVSRFPPGEYVPITISFTYRDKIYTGQTGFTPQAPLR
jgi:hypothetical protein